MTCKAGKSNNFALACKELRAAARASLGFHYHGGIGGISTGSDLDLSIGPFVGLVGCISATLLVESPVLGVLVLLLLIGAYGAIGALVHIRNLPSIVVTLGLSFVWLGIAVLILPSPGGKAPVWLKSLMSLQLPVIPFPIIAAMVIGVVVHIALMTSSYGVIARGGGGNAKALTRAGWSILKTKVIMYMLSGFFGVLSGLCLLGLTTSADAHVADRTHSIPLRASSSVAESLLAVVSRRWGLSSARSR